MTRTILKGLILLMAVALLHAAGQAQATYNPVEKPLYAGQHILIGKLVVEQYKRGTKKYLRVTYDTTSSEWVMTATHLYVGTTAPSKSAPGRFPFKHEGLNDVHVDVYDIPLAQFGTLCGDKKLYIAAHADTCEVSGCAPDFAGLTASLPTDLTAMNVTYNWTTAEFTFDWGTSTATGWCVDIEAPYPLETSYDTAFVSSYLPDGSWNPAAAALLGQQDVQVATPFSALQALNYLLNRDYVRNCSDPDLEYAIQLAVWFIANNHDPASNLSGGSAWEQQVLAKAEAIVTDVIRNAPSYVPQCGDLAVVVLDPQRLTADPTNPRYLNNNQHFGIVVPLGGLPTLGNCETAWAKGTCSFRTGWGSYFTYVLR